MQRYLKLKNTIIFLLGLFLVSSCSSIKKQEFNGCIISPQEVKNLKARKSTKRDVLKKLGSPSVKSALENEKSGDTWIYYNQTKESYLFFTPKVTDRNVVAIDFDRRGRIAKIREYDGKNSKNIIRASHTTKIKDERQNILIEMVRNVGGIASDGDVSDL